MNVKKTMLFVTLILGAAAITYFALKYRSPQIPEDKQLTEAERTTINGAYYIYNGNEGYLVKGKLLDEKFRQQYNSFPDTLATLSFGDRLFNLDSHIGEPSDPGLTAASAVANAAAAANAGTDTYRLFDTPTTPENKEERRKNLNYKFDKLFGYLLLADAGKFAYPSIVNSEYAETLSESEFDATYEPFKPLYSRDGIPFIYKKELVKFFATDKGKEFAFPANGLRDASELLVFGDLANNQKESMACVLESKDEYDTNKRNCLLIYAINPTGFPYCLYTEDYYDNIVISKFNKGDMIFMNSKELTAAPYEGIMVNTAAKQKYALVFDEHFGKIAKYNQAPASQESGE